MTGDGAAIVALEAVAARSWPAPTVTTVDGWLLRAAGGWTRRANSAVPVSADAVRVATPPVDGGGLPPIVGRIDAWYRRQGLPTVLALPTGPLASLVDRLERRRWRGLVSVRVMTAAVDRVLAAVRRRDDLPPPRTADAPDDAWLATYARPDDDTSSPQARAVLSAGGARFASVDVDGEVAAVVRYVVEPPWVGLAAMAVRPTFRRRGLGSHLLRCALAEAAASGATRAWLQVDPDNVAASRLYDDAGFATHHTYRYYTPPDEAPDRAFDHASVGRTDEGDQT